MQVYILYLCLTSLLQYILKPFILFLKFFFLNPENIMDCFSYKIQLSERTTKPPFRQKFLPLPLLR